MVTTLVLHIASSTFTVILGINGAMLINEYKSPEECKQVLQVMKEAMPGSYGNCYTWKSDANRTQSAH